MRINPMDTKNLNYIETLLERAKGLAGTSDIQPELFIGVYSMEGLEESVYEQHWEFPESIPKPARSDAEDTPANHSAPYRRTIPGIEEEKAERRDTGNEDHIDLAQSQDEDKSSDLLRPEKPVKTLSNKRSTSPESDETQIPELHQIEMLKTNSQIQKVMETVYLDKLVRKSVPVFQDRYHANQIIRSEKEIIRYLQKNKYITQSIFLPAYRDLPKAQLRSLANATRSGQHAEVRIGKLKVNISKEKSVASKAKAMTSAPARGRKRKHIHKSKTSQSSMRFGIKQL